MLVGGQRPRLRDLQVVASRSKQLKDIIAELAVVIRGYEEIAAANVVNSRPGQQFTLAAIAPEATGHLRGKTHVPVLTAAVAVQPDGRYDDVPYVAKVQPGVRLVGGINKPRQIIVEDNFHKVRSLLAKASYHCSIAKPLTASRLIRAAVALDKVVSPHVRRTPSSAERHIFCGLLHSSYIVVT